MNSRIIESVMLEIGIPLRLKGFNYIKEAIQMKMENPNISMKEIYYALSERYDSNPNRVERNFRTTLDAAKKSIDVNNKLAVWVLDSTKSTERLARMTFECNRRSENE